MLKLPPKHQDTKLHQMLVIKNIRFGGILCFSDLVAKNDFLQ